MKKVAIQGIKGSFHDIAAHQFFANEEIELICCETFEELFDTMKKDSSLLAMMAIENTIAGSLLHNYELLRASNLTIVGEHKLHIEHSLLCLPDEDINDIREINSHPVALMQCRDFLKQFRNCKIVEADDTAGAAEAISRLGLKGHAAICSKFAAPIYHMKVLREAIEDNKHNFTRFLCLCDPWNADAIRRTRQINKSSIVFSVPHEKGELSHVLSVLSFYDINMTKIQSLPIIGHEWEYLFYVDITFADYSRYRQCIEAIRPLTRQISILGEYESDPH
ncbi:MAG: prephenate dehydratase [Bacteroidaceae bacterium]|nr:prephenate dehydratase [Bacteroidaceae bacterium]